MMTGHERAYVRIFGSIVMASILVQIWVIPVWGLARRCGGQHGRPHSRPARHRLVRQPPDQPRHDAVAVLVKRADKKEVEACKGQRPLLDDAGFRLGGGLGRLTTSADELIMESGITKRLRKMMMAIC